MAEPTAILSQEEKTAILLHLGYQAQQMAVASISLGIPKATQPMFLAAMSSERIPESAVGWIRNALAILNMLDRKLVETIDQLTVESIGNIKLRADACDNIEREYVRWAQRLANYLGVPLNPYAERYSSVGGRRASRAVVHT